MDLGVKLAELEKMERTDSERRKKYIDDGARDALRTGCLILLFPLAIFIITISILLYQVFIKPPLRFVLFFPRAFRRIFKAETEEAG